MLRLLITRHGETQWNLVRRMQGHLDSPLTDLGQQQAQWLAERLKHDHIDHIYSSPLGRAYKTAEVLKGDRAICINKDERLAEIDLGNWQGQYMDDIIRMDEKNYDRFWNQPDLYSNEAGESFLDVMRRIVSFYEDVCQNHTDETILIVAHAGVLKSLICYLFYDGKVKELWKHHKLHPTSLTILNIDEHKIDVEMMADTTHYRFQRQDDGWFNDIED